MRPRRLVSLLLAASTLPALASASGCVSSPYGDFSNVPDRASCTVEIAISNMACPEACPIKVRDAVFRVQGVRDVAVDYESGRAGVEAVYPACSSDGFEQMMANLYARGYKAKIAGSYTGTTGELSRFAAQ